LGGPITIDTGRREQNEGKVAFAVVGVISIRVVSFGEGRTKPGGLAKNLAKGVEGLGYEKRPSAPKKKSRARHNHDWACVLIYDVGQRAQRRR